MQRSNWITKFRYLNSIVDFINHVSFIRSVRSKDAFLLRFFLRSFIPRHAALCALAGVTYLLSARNNGISTGNALFIIGLPY